MSLQAATVMIDCSAPHDLANWYVSTLGGELLADHGSVVIARVDGMSLNLGFQQVTEPKELKSRVHVDYLADDRVTEVRRLVDRGAVEVEEHHLGSFGWTVLRDPEGNEFCVAQAPSG